MTYSTEKHKAWLLGVQQPEAGGDFNSISSLKKQHPNTCIGIVRFLVMGLQEGRQIQEQSSHLWKNILKPPHRFIPRNQLHEQHNYPHVK